MIGEPRRREMAYRAIQVAPNARASERTLLLDALQLTAGQTVLEVGAWDGYLATALAARAVDVTLIDRTAIGVQRLRESHPTMRVMQGLQEDIPLPAESVDRVAALVALHHLNASDFLREAHRVLRARGRVAIVEVDRESRTAGFLDTHIHMLTRPRGHVGNYLTVLQWRSAISAAGFVATVEQQTARWQFSAMDEAVEYCRLVFGLATTVTASEICAAIETLAPSITHGEVAWDWPLVVAVGDRL